MKGEISKRTVITALGLFLFLWSVVNVSAEQNPPVPGPPGTFITPYDWIIEDGDDVLWQSSTIIVNGNLTIASGGKLTLEQVYLRMNCTVDGLLSIMVEDGGELVLDGCVVTSMSSTEHYRMALYGKVKMESVSLSEAYGDPEAPWEHGIELHSNDISILNSSFYYCQGNVFNVESSSPLIRGNRFYENMGAAVYTNGTSSPRILSNNIYSQRFGIISGFYSSPIIDGNTINNLYDNGILLNGYQKPVVSNNSISNCLNGMLLWYSNARMENNEIHHNEAGYNIKVDSKPTISGDEIHNNMYVGISTNDSIVVVHDTMIRDQTYDGIRSFNGSSIRIHSSNIESNGDDGFQITNAHAEVHGTLIEDNEGDSIYVRDHAVIDVFDTQVFGGDRPSTYQLNIGAASGVNMYDSTFNGDSVTFEDADSDLDVFFTCSFLVTNADQDPIAGIPINIADKTGTRKVVLGTASDGTCSRYLSFYEQRDSNSDGDGKDPGEVVYHEYGYSIDEDGYVPVQGDIDLSNQEQIHIVLEFLPTVEVIDSSPRNGEVEVSVETSIYIIFNRNIDPSTVAIDLSGPGGIPVIFETNYNQADQTLEIYPLNGFDHSKTYTMILSDVRGVDGEIFQGTFLFSFRTEAPDDPDNDEDGIPDSEDQDDDNDGYDDVVEEYYGTDPFDNSSYPKLGDDDDDDEDPGTDPDPPAGDDDDDDDDIVIIPQPPSEDDDDDTVSPYDPVDTSDEMPADPDDGENFIILVIGTIIGFLILIGVLLLIFLRSGGGGQRLVALEDHQNPPSGG
jgi:parallel beta-helix repeat protein